MLMLIYMGSKEMKQVYMCDFCSEHSENKKVIIEHEEECSFNPKNKHCYSCKNYNSNHSDIFGDSPTCSSSGDIFDIVENENKCKYYKEENKI